MYWLLTYNVTGFVYLTDRKRYKPMPGKFRKAYKYTLPTTTKYNTVNNVYFNP